MNKPTVLVVDLDRLAAEHAARQQEPLTLLVLGLKATGFRPEGWWDLVRELAGDPPEMRQRSGEIQQGWQPVHAVMLQWAWDHSTHPDAMVDLLALCGVAIDPQWALCVVQPMSVSYAEAAAAVRARYPSPPSWTDITQKGHAAYVALNGAPPPVVGTRSNPTHEPLQCPLCGRWHIDGGEWATRPHHTHRCVHPACGHEWDVGRYSFGIYADSVAVDDGPAMPRSDLNPPEPVEAPEDFEIATNDRDCTTYRGDTLAALAGRMVAGRWTGLPERADVVRRYPATAAERATLDRLVTGQAAAHAERQKVLKGIEIRREAVLGRLRAIDVLMPADGLGSVGRTALAGEQERLKVQLAEIEAERATIAGSK